MSKMGSHDPFGYLKHKLWPKEGPESNCQFDSRPLKFKNHPDLFVFRCRATCHWKALNKDYNFSLDLTLSGGLYKKLWASKVAKVSFSRISGLSTLEFRDKNDIWVLTLWSGIENTLRGKVVASPKFGSWWVLRVRVCSWLVCAPKVLQLCTNELVVWFV